ncbi:sigma-70 family RNA polymerase sigma factor [Aquicoccus sp.]|uniref:sigma-70 family RNA polymerase sigma factor n=1 Tax=Aquicoccus sp. TaxID=2055851 RepID=UPI0035634945
MNKPITKLSRGARRIATSKMLSAADERQLVRDWQDRGDRRARDRLITAFAPLAASVARRVGPKKSGELDPDLVQQANLGLIKAADRFDPERDIRFATYAIWWARAEVQAYTRANRSIVRRPNSALTRKAAARIASLEAEMSADADLEQSQADARLADALGVDTQKAAALRAQIRGSDQSLNVPAGEEGGADRIASLVDPASLDGPLALKNLETVELRRMLVEALGALPDRERAIIVATQVKDPPATLEGLGALYGVSKERVRQLRERGFERLRAAMRLRDLGIENLI